jgi:hypothetical protein
MQVRMMYLLLRKRDNCLIRYAKEKEKKKQIIKKGRGETEIHVTTYSKDDDRYGYA